MLGAISVHDRVSPGEPRTRALCPGARIPKTLIFSDPALTFSVGSERRHIDEMEIDSVRSSTSLL